MAPISGLPAIPDSILPSAVRSGSAADKQHYKAALGFEQMLVGQLVTAMAGDSGPLADGPYAQNLQTSLASALMSTGGVGLAQQLYKEIGDGPPRGLASQGANAQTASLPGGANR